MYATVVSVAPLLIQLDNAMSAVPALALTSYTEPAVDDRVIVQRVGRRYLVLGTFA